MKATATTSFKGAPDGERYPVKFSVGDDVYGELANVAVKNGWAVFPSNVLAISADVDFAKVDEDQTDVSDDGEPVKRKRGRPRNVD